MAVAVGPATGLSALNRRVIEEKYRVAVDCAVKATQLERVVKQLGEIAGDDGNWCRVDKRPNGLIESKSRNAAIECLHIEVDGARE